MKPVAASTVHATLAKHYPPRVLHWVRRAKWAVSPGVPLSRIDMARRPGARDPQKVASIAQAVRDGKPMPPVVLVNTGDAKLAIADGYHRTLGFQHAGKTKIPALVASGVGAHGPWEERMHAAKLNLTACKTAEHVIDLAGTCTGPGPCDTTPFGTGNNWVNKAGGLPAYIRAVAHSLTRPRGPYSESEAIQRAVGIIKNWAAGEGHVTAATRARAAKAVAEWEALKAKARANLTAEDTPVVDLASPTAGQLRTLVKQGKALPAPGQPRPGRYPIRNVAELHKAIRAVGRGNASHAKIRRFIRKRAKALGASHLIPDSWNTDGTLDMAVTVADTNDLPTLSMPSMPHRYRHGWVRIDANAPTAIERASRAVITDGHTLLHGKGMVAAAHRVSERVRSAGHGVKIRRVHLDGKTHLHIARTTRSK